MKPYSIEQKIIKNTLLGIGVVIILAGVLLDGLFVRHLNKEYDDNLLAKAAEFQTLTEYENGHIELDFSDNFFAEYSRKNKPEYFEIWIEDKGVLEKSLSLEKSASVSAIDLPRSLTQSMGYQFQNMILPDGRAGRMIQVDYYPEYEQDDKFPYDSSYKKQITLVLAKERESLDRIIVIAHITLASVILLSTFIFIFIIRLTVRRAFIPIKEAQLKIAEFNVENLGVRLKLAKTPLELEGFITHFNHMIERLEKGFLQERQFSADVAHELRTPIAEVLTIAEVALKWPDAVTSKEDIFQDIVNASQRMQRLVNNLLALSRCETGSFSLAPQLMNVELILESSWQSLENEATRKAISLQLQLQTTEIVVASTDIFAQIVNNLLANAITYSPQKTVIIVTAHVSNHAMSLAITNTNDNLKKTDLPFIFDRLWRKDQSRTSDQHAGLGLALVKAYAELLGINVVAELSNDNALFTITLNHIRIA